MWYNAAHNPHAGRVAAAHEYADINMVHWLISGRRDEAALLSSLLQPLAAGQRWTSLGQRGDHTHTHKQAHQQVRTKDCCDQAAAPLTGCRGRSAERSAAGSERFLGGAAGCGAGSLPHAPARLAKPGSC